MAILGAHMLTAGGLHRSIERAVAASCQCVQVFTKNNNQWMAKPITDEQAQQFQQALEASSVGYPIAHSSYLINLASPEPTLRKRSQDAMVVELERADRLAIPHVVLHPGAYTTSSETTGIRNICRSLNNIHRRTRTLDSQILLETTAGQGSCVGWQFEQLADILAGVDDAERLGICFDTCHVYAAGYPLTSRREYLATMRRFDEVIGLKKIAAFHLNDSKRDRGSRVDRHEHIGRGHLGLDPFRWLVNDRRFRRVPMYLETPKGTENGRDLDVCNLQTLRDLIEPK